MVEDFAEISQVNATHCALHSRLTCIYQDSGCLPRRPVTFGMRLVTPSGTLQAQHKACKSATDMILSITEYQIQILAANTAAVIVKPFT